MQQNCQRLRDLTYVYFSAHSWGTPVFGFPKKIAIFVVHVYMVSGMTTLYWISSYELSRLYLRIGASICVGV